MRTTRPHLARPTEAIASSVLACLLAIMLPAAAAQARGTAPLPAAFEDRTTRGEFEVRDDIPALRGTYAHGVSGGPVFEQAVDPDEADQADGAEDADGAAPARPICNGSEEERRALLARYASVARTEYWFYGTSQQGVLFLKSVLPLHGGTTPPPCSDAVATTHEIQRAFVADGFTHNFTLDETSVPGIGSFRNSRSAGEYSGSFMQLQSLMARAPLPVRGAGTELTREKVAGQRAICAGRGGLVWSSTCYAVDRPIRGMLLQSGAGDDQRTMFHSRVLDIRPGILLPGRVFEVDRDWRLREDP